MFLKRSYVALMLFAAGTCQAQGVHKVVGRDGKITFNDRPFFGAAAASAAAAGGDPDASKLIGAMLQFAADPLTKPVTSLETAVYRVMAKERNPDGARCRIWRTGSWQASSRK